MHIRSIHLFHCFFASVLQSLFLSWNSFFFNQSLFVFFSEHFIFSELHVLQRWINFIFILAWYFSWLWSPWPFEDNLTIFLLHLLHLASFLEWQFSELQDSQPPGESSIPSLSMPSHFCPDVCQSSCSSFIDQLSFLSAFRNFFLHLELGNLTLMPQTMNFFWIFLWGLNIFLQPDKSSHSFVLHNYRYWFKCSLTLIGAIVSFSNDY